MATNKMRFHFSPPKNWMNDPNGLIYHNGFYHLFYQHNPMGRNFGNISWGHAKSKDLIKWEYLPVALTASEGKMMYSGCVVYDEINTLKHPDGPALVAFYTEHLFENETNYVQSIALATSHDDGLTWDMKDTFRLNHPKSKDFRDPKVFWHTESQKWVMLVALSLSYKIEFYESTDLRNWKYNGFFTSEAPCLHSWECPDLFTLKDEYGRQRWIMTLSGDHPDGKGWGMFYFIGDFNGKVFLASEPHEWLDHGHDFYAGITFEGTTDKVLLGWCGNWAYAQNTIPNSISNMSLPRKLSLRNGTLYQQINFLSHLGIEPLIQLSEPNTRKDLMIYNSKKEPIEIEIYPNQIKLDRSKSSLFHDHREFLKLNYELKIEDISVFQEHDIIEIMINNGEFTITEKI